MNISLLTLGCPKNRVDSEKLLKAFLKRGIGFIENPSEADVLLVNTCGFIEDAKKESIEEILKTARFKNNGKKLLVFGCLAKRYGGELMREIPEIDAIFGVGEEEAIIKWCADTSACAFGMPHLPDSKGIATPYAYLKIAEGCNKKCTFCVIPSIRGAFRSAPREEILKEAEEKISSGVKELILVAQDITDYGRDNGHSLVSLLGGLSSLKGDFFIRLLYLYPSSITDELLELISSERKIYKYLDIPLQHSEDRVLKLMGRRGSKNEYKKLLRKIRRMMPDAALRTTFIAGFPGETEEDFRGLVDFVEEVRFERLGVFKYSKEEGMAASKMAGHMTASVKERRLDELMRVQSRISYEKNKELVGRRFRALIDEIDGATAIGRIYSQAPEIDGVTFITGDSLREGGFADVVITGAMDYDLNGAQEA